MDYSSEIILSFNNSMRFGENDRLVDKSENSLSLTWFKSGFFLHVISSFLASFFPPKSVTESKTTLWKWRTTFAARVSAAITGHWAILTLINSPVLMSDLMAAFTVSAYTLILFSLGVHFAEVLDILLNSSSPGMLMIHHLFVLICFSGAIFTNRAIGFAVLCLVTEINAVFNKTRIIHHVTSTPKESFEFRINSILNVLTFFIRILIIGWINNQCFLYTDVLPVPFLLSCAAGVGVVNLWNLSVFKVLVTKDILRKMKSS